MKWSALDRAIAAWVCILATCAIIIVLAGLSEIIGKNSSSIASWVQAIGSIVAIFGASWASIGAIKYQHNRDDRAKRDEAAIIGVSLISNMASAVEALNRFRSSYYKTPNVTQKGFVTYLTNTLNIGAIPNQEFCIRMAQVHPDFARSMAIALESLRQLRPHMERCKDQQSRFVDGVVNPLLE